MEFMDGSFCSAAIQYPWKLDSATGFILGRPIDGGADATVLHLVLDHALLAPNETAVVAGGQRLTFQSLVAWAERIAYELILAEQGAGAIVSILAEPGAGMIAGVLGTMLAGCTYLPLDISSSDDRIASIFKDAAVTYVVADECGASKAQGLPVVHLGGVGSGDATTPKPASLSGRVVLSAPSTVEVGLAPAYVIYTSGSTGMPKGVKVSHQSLAASTAARRMVYPGKPIFLMVSPLAFDSSVAGIWGTLTAGGTVVVASRDEMRDSSALVDLIADQGVTHLLCVPSLYRFLLAEANTRDAEDVASLKCAIVAGEALDDILVKRHFASPMAGACLVNEYGPTEATVWATYRVLEAESRATIGGPIPGAVLAVVDDAGMPIACGEVGELLIGGASVSDGYLNALPNDQSFFLINNAFGVPERFYRTGDQVRLLEGGQLSFVGRRDQQVKVRGHRIELLALENTLLELLGVQNVCALVSGEGDSLFVFIETEEELSEEELRTFVQKKMGAAYVPSLIAFMPKLPISSTGKVDRQALGRLVSHDAKRSMPVAQQHRKEETTVSRVARVWAMVLQRDDIPLATNFFDLGGHSLLVFELQGALEQQFGQRPSAIDLFHKTTVMDQATLFEADRRETPPAGKEQASVTEAQASTRGHQTRQLRLKRRDSFVSKAGED